ncbi:hypothetical protein ACFV7R_18650 [Streptomyces sp. NPDC059866]|uniref:hypothetical protein n=1 Tax=Streptomyces sp. NPDC059866 TaxID=3346978 RepID=UPI00365FD112
MQTGVHDADAKGAVAGGWGVPIRWDGLVASLPTGYTDALVRAVEGREQGVVPDTLVICGAVVTPRSRGAGWQAGP